METISLGLSKIFTLIFILIGMAAQTIGFCMWLATIIGVLMGFGSEMTTMQLGLWFTALTLLSVISSGFMKFINECEVDLESYFTVICIGVFSLAPLSYFGILKF